MDALRQQVMLSQFVFVAGCHPEQARQLLTECSWQFEMALSKFFQESSTPLCRTNVAGCHYQMCTPSNTPVTPPNFPDALAALAKMSTTDMATSPVAMLSSPLATAAASNAVVQQTNSSVPTVIQPLSQRH
jgi:hypothetical protein